MNGNDMLVMWGTATSRARRQLALEHVTAEIDALDAWRDARCAGIWIEVGSLDAGGYGCTDESEADRNGGHHDECPVEVARVALFAATDRRRAL